MGLRYSLLEEESQVLLNFSDHHKLYLSSSWRQLWQGCASVVVLHPLCIWTHVGTGPGKGWQPCQILLGEWARTSDEQSLSQQGCPVGTAVKETAGWGEPWAGFRDVVWFSPLQLKRETKWRLFLFIFIFFYSVLRSAYIKRQVPGEKARGFWHACSLS